MRLHILSSSTLPLLCLSFIPALNSLSVLHSHFSFQFGIHFYFVFRSPSFPSVPWFECYCYLRCVCVCARIFLYIQVALFSFSSSNNDNNNKNSHSTTVFTHFTFYSVLKSKSMRRCEYTTNTIELNWIEWKKADQSKCCKTVKSIAKNRLDATRSLLCALHTPLYFIFWFCYFYSSHLTTYLYKQTYVDIYSFIFKVVENTVKCWQRHFFLDLPNLYSMHQI